MKNDANNNTIRQKSLPILFLGLLFASFALSWISGCGETNNTGNPNAAISAKQPFLESYLPPTFQSEDRAASILEVRPQLDMIFEDYAEANHFPGFVYGVVLDKELVYSGTYGVVNLESEEKVTEASLFHIASMTKSFTSMAILKLRDEGRLALTDPVSKYIPEFAEQIYLTEDATPVTIKNLMTMSSGFPEDNPWADRQLEESDEAFLDMIKGGLSFSTIPSSGYEYSNLGYAMLGTIINNVTGTTYQDYITKEVLLPLGMDHTIWEYEDAPANLLAQGYRWEDEQWKEEPLLHSGAFGAIGGLITSLEDFSKYVAFHLSAWPPRNGPETGPIKRSSVREMHQMTFPRLNPNSTKANGDPCPVMIGYGYGFRIQKDCEGKVKVAHSGGLPGYGSEYRFFPEYGLGIISFANRTYAGSGGANDEADKLLWQDDRLKPREIALSPILQQRKGEVQEWLQTWDETLANKIMAENFFLDQSLHHRQKELMPILEKIGEIESTGPMTPLNQMRGYFTLHGTKNDAKVFFTLSPEKVPKVQALYAWILE